ncbi:hypothetical protein [Saccharopolyspora hattusasensis]|uniref:hypothetical protein n=1 Tax=Saccharopolyspora hattusasensis TaxID=1128679 RepID=UPI003D979718
MCLDPGIAQDGEARRRERGDRFVSKLRSPVIVGGARARINAHIPAQALVVPDLKHAVRVDPRQHPLVNDPVIAAFPLSASHRRRTATLV